MKERTELRGREKFKKARNLIYIIIKIINILPKRSKNYLFRLFRNVNGIAGIGIRYVLLKTLAKNLGENVSIHPDVYLLSPENIDIGDNVSIHPMSYIDATGGIEIGSDVSIAHGTTILSTTHTYEEKYIFIKNQPILKNKTILESNIWIGAKATILNGVTIKSGSIIAASSVVTKNTQKDSIFGGVPAVFIKKRF